MATCNFFACLNIKLFTAMSIILICYIFLLFLLGSDLDVFARRSLYSIGLDYQHSTGHGIGHFLSVHEGEFNSNYLFCVKL